MEKLGGEYYTCAVPKKINEDQKFTAKLKKILAPRSQADLSSTPIIKDKSILKRSTKTLKQFRNRYLNEDIKRHKEFAGKCWEIVLQANKKEIITPEDVSKIKSEINKLQQEYDDHLEEHYVLQETITSSNKSLRHKAKDILSNFQSKAKKTAADQLDKDYHYNSFNLKEKQTNSKEFLKDFLFILEIRSELELPEVQARTLYNEAKLQLWKTPGLTMNKVKFYYNKKLNSPPKPKSPAQNPPKMPVVKESSKYERRDDKPKDMTGWTKHRLEHGGTTYYTRKKQKQKYRKVELTHGGGYRYEKVEPKTKPKVKKPKLTHAD